jgi:hypothetical protein
MGTCRDKHELISYAVIEAAVSGDVEAMNAILQHYSGYITSLSSRYGFDRHGCPQSWVDEGIRKRLETRLIIATLRFE